MVLLLATAASAVQQNAGAKGLPIMLLFDETVSVLSTAKSHDNTMPHSCLIRQFDIQ
jgi:hypothetical protein